MSRKPQTRYPHVFSKGKGPGFHSQGSWRQGVGMGRPPKDTLASSPATRGRWPEGTEGARGAPMTTHYPMKLDPRRWKYLKVSPTIANLYRGHLGVAVICADCLHGVAHRNPGLPDRFKRQWHLTLLELEKKCRCEMCGSRNARVYPWWGDAMEGALGLEGPPRGGR